MCYEDGKVKRSNLMASVAMLVVRNAALIWKFFLLCPDYSENQRLSVSSGKQSAVGSVDNSEGWRKVPLSYTIETMYRGNRENVVSGAMSGWNGG